MTSMKKFESYCKALENLRLCRNYSAPYEVVTLAGLVSLFEICFGQSWKAMREVLAAAGFAETKSGSPKLIIKTAFSAQMIADENTWLDILDKRNILSHSYDGNEAAEIVEAVKNKFLPLFEELAATIRKGWL